MSNNEEKRELLIPFESFLNRGIHKEKPESFQESFFKDVYSQAAKAIAIIDESNKKKNNDIANNANFEQKLYDVQNVIAFTGRRGTGKTSAMLTFVDSLVAGKYAGSPSDFLKNTRFYSIPYIDASMLEANEDIFEIVLSKMLLELNNSASFSSYHDSSKYDANISDTRENIVSVYSQYVALKKELDCNSASSYSLMEKLAERHDIRSKIVELIKKYINCMTMRNSAYYESEHTTDYLVICIDDVDMSQKNHMEVMQSIYQYLMIPGIVVMITSNFSMLSASIERTFHSKVFVSNEQEQNSLNLSKEQTYDFLRKIIPFDMRISMPSWRKQDYRSLTSIKVILGNNGYDMKKLKKMFNRLEQSSLFNGKIETEKFSPKTLIMIMIAHRTKIFLDVAGEKLHFMEPDSLRNLNDLFYLLYNMNNIDLYEDESDDYFRELEANRKVLLNFLYFKMIPESNLSYEEEQIIKEFARDRLYRKGRRIWDQYYKLFTRTEEKEKIERLYGKDFYDSEIKKNKVENYSFGELFRILYFGSRLNLMSREFIQVILASFSFIMPQFIETEKDNENKNKKNNNNETPKADQRYSHDTYTYRPIRDVFRYTFLGTWCDDLFGGKTVDIVVKKDKINIENFKNFIYPLMLTPMSTGEEIPVEKEGDKFIISAKLDPTALFMNLVRIKRISDLKFTGNLSLKDLLEKIISEKTVLVNIYENVLYPLKNADEYTVFEKLLGISKNEAEDALGLSWFLLKNTDITYNVIKRVVIYLIYLSDNNLRDKKRPKSTPEEAIKAFYKNFNKKLNEEFEVYNKERSKKWDFEGKLMNIPVVDMFFKESDCLDSDSNKDFYIKWSD